MKDKEKEKAEVIDMFISIGEKFLKGNKHFHLEPILARDIIQAIKELKKENEQLKKYIYRCWHEEEINDYSNHSTNTDSEFKELVNRLKNGS